MATRLGTPIFPRSSARAAIPGEEVTFGGAR
jgi:hypothetical protein